MIITQSPGWLKATFDVVDSLIGLKKNIKVVGELLGESFPFVRVCRWKSFIQLHILQVLELICHYNRLRITTIRHIYFPSTHNNSQATCANIFDTFVLKCQLLEINIFIEVLLHHIIGPFQAITDYLTFLLFRWVFLEIPKQKLFHQISYFMSSIVRKHTTSMPIKNTHHIPINLF